MENMLVVVFNDERTAYEGLSYLNQLGCDGVIKLFAGSVIAKETGGRVTEVGRQGTFAFHTIAGTAVAAAPGVLAGPTGSGVGATVGELTGFIRDLHTLGVNSDFVNDVEAVLTPGKCAIVADLDEEYITPIDARMKALGGVVFRTEKKNLECELEQTR